MSTSIAFTDYAVMRGKTVVRRCHTYEEAWAWARQLKGGYIQYRGCTPAEYSKKKENFAK